MVERTLMRFVTHKEEMEWHLFDGDLTHLNGLAIGHQPSSGSDWVETTQQKELRDLLVEFTADDVFYRRPLERLPRVEVTHIINCYRTEGLKKWIEDHSQNV